MTSGATFFRQKMTINLTYLKKQLYCKTVDSKMYGQLKSSLERFQTDQNIIECLHKYDAQSKED